MFRTFWNFYPMKSSLGILESWLHSWYLVCLPDKKKKIKKRRSLKVIHCAFLSSRKPNKSCSFFQAMVIDVLLIYCIRNSLINTSYICVSNSLICCCTCFTVTNMYIWCYYEEYISKWNSHGSVTLCKVGKELVTELMRNYYWLEKEKKNKKDQLTS